MTLQERDTLQLAEMLAEAVKAEAPDLVLTGLQSDDLGLGQTGVVLAELLGMPHATIIKQVEAAAGGGLKVKRELEDGWFQHVEMPLPALLTIQSGGNKLRYATLMGIKRAKSKETKTVEPAAPTGERAVAMERVYLPEKVKKTEMLTGTPARGCGEDCGEAEVRGEGAMSGVLVVLEQRASSKGRRRGAVGVCADEPGGAGGRAAAGGEDGRGVLGGGGGQGCGGAGGASLQGRGSRRCWR